MKKEFLTVDDEQIRKIQVFIEEHLCKKFNCSDVKELLWNHCIDWYDDILCMFFNSEKNFVENNTRLFYKYNESVNDYYDYIDESELYPIDNYDCIYA